MRIKTLKYKNHQDEWGIHEMNFSHLSLLVGVSGVGKTQILRAIMQLKRIASGYSFNSGIEWEVSFVHDQVEFFWKGKFKLNLNTYLKANNQVNDGDNDLSHLSFEKLLANDQVLAEWKEGDLFFGGSIMPKLGIGKSVIEIFKAEKIIELAYRGFRNIYFRDHAQSPDWLNYDNYPFILPNNLDEFDTVKKIRNSIHFGLLTKVTILYKQHTNLFRENIVEKFASLFSVIEDIKFVIEDYMNEDLIDLDILFKQKGVNKWISYNRMSSGMLRVFHHICEMYLLSDDVVLLIDEFENSLGVNCIDFLTEDLLYENKRIQFIATSHHPYIINQIPYQYWKVITRRGGTIIAHDANEFNLGESSHERFMNLINLPAYKNGIESL